MLGVPKHPPVTQATTLSKVAEKKATHLSFVQKPRAWLVKLLLQIVLIGIPEHY